MRNVLKILGLALLMMICCPGISKAGKVVTEEKNDVVIIYQPQEDHTIIITGFRNLRSDQIHIYIDNNEDKPITINPHGSFSPKNLQATNRVRVKLAQEGREWRLWKKSHPATPKAGTSNATEDKKPVNDPPSSKEVKAKEEKKDNKPAETEKPTVTEPVKPAMAETAKPSTDTDKKSSKHNNTDSKEEKKPVIPEKKVEEIIKPTAVNTGNVPIVEKINLDNFFGQGAVIEFVEKCEVYKQGLADATDKAAYIRANELKSFLAGTEAEINMKRDDIPVKAQGIVTTTKGADTYLNVITEILTARLSAREKSYLELKASVADAEAEAANKGSGKGSVINYIIIGLLVAGIIAWVVLKMRKRKAAGTTAASPSASTSTAAAPKGVDAEPGIVVKRRTASVLKKQSLEDLVGNPAYLVINASEFTPDSAVRNIYIKNTCIKEVYDMYADDLRNTDNPKEDGCMVLGRWVYDEASQTYDVSMEYVVMPGDDAVFKEYELNFGGKIKMRVAEKLRKLRSETNLQYDLICWIHSHPGLGVFFSNSDDTVQSQLKHPQHPNFLVAFVVDILTANQETGIFTFRKDGSMNSKNDLTRLYSLEEMYKWALDSDRLSFNPENYYNILGKCEKQLPACRGIELDNSSIIDLSRLVLTPANGIVGWAVGTSVDTPKGKEYVVSKIVASDGAPVPGAIGMVVSSSHFSLLTVQRLIKESRAHISFVIVYSSRQAALTVVPVFGGELPTDEKYYGEETIDDLKIWTRRKR